MVFRFIYSAEGKNFVDLIVSFFRRSVVPVSVSAPEGEDVVIGVFVDVYCNFIIAVSISWHANC